MSMPLRSVTFDVTTPDGWENARRWLAGHRRRVGLTQRVVAQRMGTTADVVSKLETGRSDPRVATIQRYVRALDLVPGWQLRDAQTGKPLPWPGRASAFTD